MKMTEGGGVARLIVTNLLCAAVMIYCMFAAFIKEPDNITNKSVDITASFFPDNQRNAVNTPKESKEKPADISSETETSDDKANSSISVSGSGTTVGAVIEKFISPYTANTAFNNVYLKNSTNLDVDIKELLSSPLGFKINKNKEPQVLIVHTHATETYLTHTNDHYTNLDVTRSTDNSRNMVSIGKIVADRLNGAGITTVQAQVQHDYPEYNNSYSRAAKTITSYLKKYPTIKIVIDLHRDAIASGDTDKVKLTTEIKGKKAAQIMIVMGSQSGGVTNFPDWKENLKLAVRLQQTIEVMYPSLARALSLMPKNYNESLTKGSMLIEIGTDGNTLEEAKYSAELLSDSLIALLNTLE